MREERKARRDRAGSARMLAQEAEKSGMLVMEAKGAGFAYGDRTIISEATTAIMRGDKVGLIGPNGSGKTTLLRLLLGELEPTSGSVRRGTNLEIAYFDQLRATLDEEATVRDNVSGGYDNIVINGQPRHIIGYLEDFLFAPERSRTPVKLLSGGERNRLLLAKLFTKPSNLMVLDEPTNDLDVETLELLESLLIEYQGTVLLVSHDRSFLNNVVTGVLSVESDGQVRESPGGYDDWLRRSVAEAAKSGRRGGQGDVGSSRLPRHLIAKGSQARPQGASRAGGTAETDRGPGDRAVSTPRRDGWSRLLSARRSRDRPDLGAARGDRRGACRRLRALGASRRDGRLKVRSGPRSRPTAPEPAPLGNPTLAETYQTIAKVGEIPEGEGRPFEVGDHFIAVFLANGVYHAMDDSCPHQGAPLCDGFVGDGSVSCSWHGWEFRLDDGRYLDNPKIQVRTYPVRVVGEEIQVGV